MTVKKNALVLVALLYFVSFGTIILPNIGTKVFEVLVLIIMLFYLLLQPKQFKNIQLSRQTSYFHIYHIFIIVYSCIIIFIVFDDYTYVASSVVLISSFPLILSSLILLFFSLKKAETGILIIEKMTVYIGIILVIQLFFSAYESITQHYFIAGYKDFTFFESSILVMQHKSILSVFNIPNPFNSQFTGLLNISANIWGAQLVFYNLLFLFVYYNNRSQVIRFFVLLTMVAVFLNGGRFAIFTIVVTDFLFYYKLAKNRKFFWGCSVLIAFLFLMNFSEIITEWQNYLSQTDTWTNRYIRYQFWTTDIISNIDKFIFGYGYKATLRYTLYSSNLATGREYGSTENLIFSIIFSQGIIGLSVFFFYVFTTYRKIHSLSKSHNIFALLILFNIFGISITVCNFFCYEVYLFYVLSLTYLNLAIIKQQSNDQ